MKQAFRRIILISIYSLFIFSCEKENQPPTCNIYSPSDGATILRGEKVTIKVNAKDPDGTIEGIKIFIGSKSFQPENSNPFSYEWDTKDENIGGIEIKALAVDNGLLEAESIISVTIEIKEASVLTKDVSDITFNSATCSGQVMDDGGSDVSEKGICWDTEPNPTIEKNKKKAGSGLGNFSVELNQLESNTKYYYRAYAVNEKDITYGEDNSFKTEIEILIPTVETYNAYNITESFARLNGKLISDGNSNPSVGFYWSKTNTLPDESDNKISASKSADGTFNTAISNLEPNTTYYYRAYAKNTKGTGYGKVVSFTTEESRPSVETLEATEITKASAILNGNVLSDGNSTNISYGFYWSKTNESPDENDEIENVPYSQDKFNIYLTQLESNHIYYYRAFISNNKGIDLGLVKKYSTVTFDNFTDPRDGRNYKTVKIGNAIWMAENLSFLPKISDPSVGSDTEPCYYIYEYDGENINEAKNTEYFKTYGVLYNSAAAILSCPNGWHLPSTKEWDELAEYISEQKGPFTKYQVYWEGVGKHLKACNGWYNSGNGHDSFGFGGLPGGYRKSVGTFNNIRDDGYWWSSSKHYVNGLLSGLFLKNLDGDYDRLFQYEYGLDLGLNVRCVKD